MLFLATAGSANAQGFAWWKSDQLKKEIGLTDDQCDRIDAVVQSTLPTLRQGKSDLDKQEAELSRLIETNADEASVAKQIDRVETVRSFLNKTRTLMLLHERQIMTPEQRVAFKASYDKSVQARRNDGDHRPDGDHRNDNDPRSRN
jgi:Spy/CpxP family protein refolding chaperone